MSNHLEIEFKSMLTLEEYRSLRSTYQLTDSFTQTNVYFDTPNQTLKTLQMGLRIRLLPDSGELTLKVPQTIGLLEINDQLSLAEANKLITEARLPETGAVVKHLETLKVPVSSLTVIAKLTTKRSEKQLPIGLLVVDESWYGQEHDYELEVEVTDFQQGQEAFHKFLATNQLPYRPSQNKILRAVAEKQRRQQ